MKALLKVSCILTSFNRPRWVRDALRSVAVQTHRNFELIVIDESDEFEIEEAVKEFSFPEVYVRSSRIDPSIRRLENRLSVNCNRGLSMVSGDLICFLADDDYYYPDWFEKAVKHFEENQSHQAAFGRLVYSYSPVMGFSPNPDPKTVRWYQHPTSEPAGKLDHNQVIHRRFEPHFNWPTAIGTLAGPDAVYFQEIARQHNFHPIDAYACVKRLHPKSLLESQQTYIGGAMEGLRE